MTDEAMVEAVARAICTETYGRLENGQLDMAVAGAVVQHIAAAMAGWFRESGAENYVEMSLNARDEPFERYVVTVQKVGRLSPHEARVAAEARAEEAEAERDALAGRRPEVLLHWDSDGDFSWGATDGVDVVCVDERCPNDRVYETTGALSVEVIQRVADGRARHPIDALDQIAREATTPEDHAHD